MWKLDLAEADPAKNLAVKVNHFAKAGPGEQKQHLFYVQFKQNHFVEVSKTCWGTFSVER